MAQNLQTVTGRTGNFRSGTVATSYPQSSVGQPSVGDSVTEFRVKQRGLEQWMQKFPALYA